MDAFEPTNTFVSAGFDILKMDGVEDPLINVNKLATMDFEESYFESAIEFVKESTEIYASSKIKLYQTIAESAGNDKVILEGFIDFFSTVKDIIDKFLKFIKSLFDRFINALASLIGSDSYLKKHKKDLDSFKAADEFDITGYVFTFDENIPATGAARNFSQDIFNDIHPDDTGILTVEMLKNLVSNHNHENEYDKFRAEILSKTGYISNEDYSEELFRVFRNDSLDTENITVDTSYLRKAKERYFGYDKAKSAVKRNHDNIKKEYEAIEKQVRDITKNNANLSATAFVNRLPDGTGIKSIDSAYTNNGMVTGDFMASFDVYVKDKADMIQEMSNLHALAFSAKLDALKDCYKQDKATLYTALSKIKRTDKQREV